MLKSIVPGVYSIMHPEAVSNSLIALAGMVLYQVQDIWLQTIWCCLCSSIHGQVLEHQVGTSVLGSVWSVQFLPCHNNSFWTKQDSRSSAKSCLFSSKLNSWHSVCVQFEPEFLYARCHICRVKRLQACKLVWPARNSSINTIQMQPIFNQNLCYSKYIPTPVGKSWVWAPLLALLWSIWCLIWLSSLIIYFEISNYHHSKKYQVSYTENGHLLNNKICYIQY